MNYTLFQVVQGERLIRHGTDKAMKIVIPGGTGQVGTLWARAFHRDGHEVTVWGRQPPKPAPWRVERWNPADISGWAQKLEGIDVLVNLAGRSVSCRYTAENRRQIMESRVESVRALGKAIAALKNPPRVWLQASTATIYAHTYEAAHDEVSGAIGGSEPDAPASWRFSIEVASAWEAALDEVLTPATRTIKLRSAVVMNPDRGGIFDTLLGLVRRGLGGASGNGRQYVSWIHETDFVNSVYFLLEHEAMNGVVNLSSPNPLPNREFMAELRQAWGAKVGLPATQWMLEIGAAFMGTESELVLKSRRVIPGRLLKEGFQFAYPEWAGAARELCARWRREQS
jgi:uncharacterized protein (TIGR01777 family)